MAALATKAFGPGWASSPPTTSQRLRGELDDDQIIEFCMTVGHYVMAAMMLNVARRETEGSYALAD